MSFVCTRCKRDVETPGLFCPFCGAAAPQPDAEPDDPYVGKTIAEKYFVNGLIGRGGMGQVYKATHITLDRPVALKMLNKSFLSDASMVQRFHREARAASRLNHPNCISILDFGQTEDGALYIAMEYLPGRSLAKLLQDEFPLGELRVVRIVGQILGALAEAHAAGIIHRDLKLANVMVEPRRDEPDFVKVLDFGIAKLTEGGAGHLTGTGIVCGTPGYMSPEQARGEELDARSDIYAVGVILYELLTGRLPFESETPMGFVAKHMTEIPVPPRERRPDLRISPSLDELVVRTLAKDREARPSSAEDMRELLYTCELLPPEEAPPPAAAAVRSSTMVFQAVPSAEAPEKVRPAAPPSGVRPAPGLRKFEVPSRAGEPAGAPARPQSGSFPDGARPGASAALPRTPAPGSRTPAPGSRTPAPGSRTPAPGSRTPAPAPRTPAPRAAAPRTPTPAARRTPPPVEPEAEELERDAGEESEAATPEPGRPARAGKAPRAGSSRKILLVAGAAAVLLLAIGGYALLRTDPFAASPEQGAGAAARTEPELKLRKAGDAPAGAGPSLARPGPLPPPPATSPEQAASAEAAGSGAAIAQPVSAEAARPEPVAKPQPPVAVSPPPPPPPIAAERVPAVVERAGPAPSRTRKKGSGAVEVIEGMNVLKVPAAATGQGILTITASPWANAFLDGRELGETPREARVGEGSYRIRLAHPTLGTRETTVTVPAGRRTVYSANLAK